jgi:ABC-2 type transport system ATP-binding protein
VTNTIEIGGISKSFGSHKAIENVTFQVKKGEIFGFLGPNGAGKTTTIRCLMNFITPDTGKIKVLGQDAQANSVAVKSMIGYVASDHHLVEKWTAREHIDYIMHLRGAGGDYRGLLKQFSLDLDRRVKVLSTGNRQKLNLILGLIGEPKVLVLDEPTAGVDIELRRQLWDYMNRLNKEGLTILLTTHYLEEAENLCARTAIIHLGELKALAPTKKLISDMGSKNLEEVFVKLTYDSTATPLQAPNAAS